MELELERVKLTSSVKAMSPSAAEQTFMAKLEERDREIIKLRQEVAQITDKINMVIDTKDAQIRVSHPSNFPQHSPTILATSRPWWHRQHSPRLQR